MLESYDAEEFGAGSRLMDKLRAAISIALPVEPTAQPLVIPNDVREAANSLQNRDYCGPVAWAKKVIDFVADYATPPPVAGDADDAARFRWAIASEDNADTVTFAVISNSNDGDAIRAEVDAAIAAGGKNI